jgi:hypothetical protein
MTILACVATLLFGLLFAHVLKTICTGLCSAGSDRWAYYFSGTSFAVLLAVPTIPISAFAQHLSSRIIGLPAEHGFRILFLALTSALLLYLIAARRFQLVTHNLTAMSLIAIATVGAVVGMVFSSGGSYGAYEAIATITLNLALVPSQIALAKLHRQHEDY